MIVSARAALARGSCRPFPRRCQTRGRPSGVKAGQGRPEAVARSSRGARCEAPLTPTAPPGHSPREGRPRSIRTPRLAYWPARPCVLTNVSIMLVNSWREC
jgi:hypothetical protein